MAFHLTGVPQPGQVFLPMHIPVLLGGFVLGPVFGFFVGFASCAFTTLLKVPVGNGDTKYCAVLGMCIYLQSFLQSMVLVGLIAIICLIYLKATKKGGIKTMIPLGPLISLATVISICFPYLPNFLAKLVSQVEI